MPKRKRIPAKPIPEDTVIIDHEFDDEDQAMMMSDEDNAVASSPEEAGAFCSLDGESADVIATIKLSHSKNPQERKAALKTMCPCKVKREVDPFWVRIVEMCSDPDDAVRYQVLHSLCDGSPASIEHLVVEAVRSFWNDPSDKIKRAARRAYNSWQRGDGINIL
eukprot:gnl/Spiro4/23344_TR11550_c0_g1_i1.p2 gnl/Spiro4/23344_TR11550_c0_g1~~gnl/Spiro4/23344_TR11550_c0_g1_i1.p2  ORF type:complete len:164 (+),score=31.60 gnl/Spiro4/23344_TR11550_c0_g1_i1:133-624(+)